MDFFFFLRFYLLIHVRETETSRGRNRLPARSQIWELIQIPGSRPELKADAQLLSHPRVPPSPFLHAHLSPTEGRLGYSFLFMSYTSICGSGEPLWVMQGGSRCRFLWACLPGIGEGHLLPHSSPVHLPLYDCESLPAVAVGLSFLC